MSKDDAAPVAERPAHKDVQEQHTPATRTSDHASSEANSSRTSTGPQSETAKHEQFARNFQSAVAPDGSVATNTASIYKQGDLSLAPPPKTVGDSSKPGDQGSDASTGYVSDRHQYPKDQGDKSRQTDAIKPGEKPEDAEKRQAAELREHMNDPKNQMTDQQKKLLDQSINQIEGNKLADGSDRQPPLKPEQKAELLHQSNRMFNESDRLQAQGLDSGDRNRAVTAMMRDSANPGEAAQGHANTCNVTTIEKVRSATEPEKQAKQFVDMYTNSNGDHTVTMPDGKKIEYDPNSLKGGKEAKLALQENTMGADLRDQYTQGMNHLLVNDTSQRRHPPEYYTQGNPTSGRSDTGERLHTGGFDGAEKAKTNDRGQVLVDSNNKAIAETSPNMGVDDVSAEMKRQTGQSSTLASKDRFGGTDKDVANVKTTADLDKAWAANGGKPMIVAVDTGSSLYGQQPGQGGGHVEVLDQQRVVDDGNGKSHTEYHKQGSWGKDSTGWVRSDQLAQSMDPSKSLAEVNNGNGPSSLSPKDMPSDGPKNATSGGAANPGAPTPAGNDGTGLPQRQQDGIKDDRTDQQKNDWLQRYHEQMKRQQEEDQKKSEERVKKQQEQEEKDRQEQERLRKMQQDQKLQNPGGDHTGG